MPFAQVRRESVRVIRAFSRRYQAADVPAERSTANLFPCGKFDFAHLGVRVRESRGKLCGAYVRDTVALGDVVETRIPRALLRYFEFFEEVCSGANIFDDASECRQRCRCGGLARTGMHTQS
jgi:hypothetical protein